MNASCSQTMFRGVSFLVSPLSFSKDNAKKAVLNETPLIKWSLIILKLTHIREHVGVGQN